MEAAASGGAVEAPRGEEPAGRQFRVNEFKRSGIVAVGTGVEFDDPRFESGGKEGVWRHDFARAGVEADVCLRPRAAGAPGGLLRSGRRRNPMRCGPWRRWELSVARRRNQDPPVRRRCGAPPARQPTTPRASPTKKRRVSCSAPGGPSRPRRRESAWRGFRGFPSCGQAPRSRTNPFPAPENEKCLRRV